MNSQEERLSETLSPIVFAPGEREVSVTVNFLNCDPQLERILVRLLLPTVPCTVIVEDLEGVRETLAEQSPHLVRILPRTVTTIRYIVE